MNNEFTEELDGLIDSVKKLVQEISELERLLVSISNSDDWDC